MDEATLRALKALVDPVRVRILGLLAERPRTAAELAGEVRRGKSLLPPAQLARQLDALRVAGLVREVDGAAGRVLALRVERLGELGRALDALEPGGSAAAPALVDRLGQPLPADEAKVLRSFLAGDRLLAIPAQPRKRDIILRWLLEACFADDRPYPEKEVNQRLALHHPDVASLRRYLVDAGHLTREAGIYRRAEPGPGPAVGGPGRA